VAGPEGFDRATVQSAHCRKLLAVPDLPGEDKVSSPAGTELIPTQFEKELRIEVDPSPRKSLTTGLTTLGWLMRDYDVIHALGGYTDDHDFETHYFRPQIRRWIKSQVRCGNLIELDDDSPP
jgi:hypothetical protein